LGICGYANESFSEITSPSITTIDQFSVFMGNSIANLYFQEKGNTDTTMKPRIVSIKPELIKRRSSDKNNKN